MNSYEGKYMYCVIEWKEPAEPRIFGPLGVGGRGDELTMVRHRDLAVVVSNSPVQEYRVTRENTMAHEGAIEVVMKEVGAVLPVRFSTIAESEEEIIEKVLKPRYGEFVDLLNWIKDKKELGLKVYWRELDAILKEIVEENEAIQSLKAAIQKKTPAQAYYDQIEIGKLLEAALNDKREKEKNALRRSLQTLASDTKVHTTYLPELVASVAFLIERETESAFDNAVNRIEETHLGRYRISYVGDAPPVNFVNIVIQWDRGSNPSLRGHGVPEAISGPEIASLQPPSAAVARNDDKTVESRAASDAGEKGEANVHS